MMKFLDHWGPRLILPAAALLALPFMDPGSWLKLGVAGLAMGMMLFLMASGLTLRRRPGAEKKSAREGDFHRWQKRLESLMIGS